MTKDESKVEETAAEIKVAFGAGAEVSLEPEQEKEVKVVPMNRDIPGQGVQPKADPKFYVKPLTLEDAKKTTYLIEIPRGAVSELMKTMKFLANNVTDSNSGGRWGNFITKNARKLNSIEMETMNILRANYPAQDSNPRIKEYGDKEFEILTKYSKKDDLGNPVINRNNNQFEIEETSKEVFESSMKSLREDYDDVMKIYEEVNMKANAIRQCRVDFEPHLILQSNLPAGILPIYYEMLDPFIIED